VVLCQIIYLLWVDLALMNGNDSSADTLYDLAEIINEMKEVLEVMNKKIQKLEKF